MRIINTNTVNNYEYYVRGAAGQIMATYRQNTTPTGTTFDPEFVLYGAARLGTATPGTAGQHRTGLRKYELTDHLASVRATVSDRRTTKGALPTILSATDYYPFGMAIKSRSSALDESKTYTYGFNGKDIQKNINKAIYDFGARMYDSRIGRWSSPDPLKHKYPNHTPYAFVGNMPTIAIDPDGKQIYIVTQNGAVLAAKETMLKTESGRTLWEKYENSTTHDIYISSQQQNLNCFATTLKDIGAMGYVKDGRISLDMKVKSNLPNSTFNGLDVSQSEGRTISLITFNEVGINLASNFRLAKTFFHELKGHIDLAVKGRDNSALSEEHARLGYSDKMTEKGRVEVISNGSPLAEFDKELGIIRELNRIENETTFTPPAK